MYVSLARVTTAVLLALPAAGRAAAPGEPIEAVRRPGPLAIDGRLDEAAWSAAVPFDGFVQRFPSEGAAPTAATEVRVLFDDRMLYVGVRCRDDEPGRVQRPLGRRDNAPFGDAVTVLVDSAGDGRSAFVFSVTAAGVLSDGLQSDDDDYQGDWDAVWEGAAAADADGWSAELAIPLAALRFQDHGQPGFGFAVKRITGRSHEEDLTVAIPRSARGQLAYLPRLIGLVGLAPSADLEIVPYAAGRLSWAPQYDDALRPRPRLFQPSADLGLDLKTSLGRGLALQGTLNPDFGQVEADQIVQNLSTFEVFFPEKRPFFMQGMDLFRPVAPQGRQSPQQLFYSRRIGLAAPILAAAKLSGALSETLQVGLVEAFVAGEGAGRPEEDPDRAYRPSVARPLWVGPRSALPRHAPAAENLTAAVARWHPDPRVSVGATATSAVLTGPRCTSVQSQESDDDLRSPRCDALGGNAAALDVALRTRDGQWFLRGQASGSQAEGGSPLRTLADGTQLRRGDLGWGGHLALGRSGGEPLRFELHWEYEAPKLDLNAVGYQRTQNDQAARAVVRWVRPTGGGPFHSWAAAASAEAHTTTDGRGLLRAAGLYAGTEFQLRSFDWFGTDAWVNARHWDVREIDQSSVADGLEAAALAQARPADGGADLWFSTDASRPLALEGGLGGGGTAPEDGLRATAAWWTWAKATVRPHPRVETRLEVSYDHSTWPARWVTDDGGADPGARRFLFGDLTAPSVSITLRQQLALSPRVTLQAYAQLFVASGRYHGFRTAAARGGRVRGEDLVPAPRPEELSWWDNPDFRSGTLRLNAVLRWEYRLGSLVYLVYARSQDELGYPDGSSDPSPRGRLWPWKLGAGPTTDTLLVKWSYWWSR